MNYYTVETFDRKPLLKRRQYYFRLRVVGNREIIAQSEGVANRADRDEVAGRLARKLGAYLVEAK